MKKIFLLIAMITLSVVATNAQVSFGLKAGLNASYLTNVGTNSSNVSGSTSSTTSSKIKLGGQFGIYANIHFGKVIGFQPELLFSMKGSKYVSDSKTSNTENKVTQDISLNYIEIPLQLRINPTKNFFMLVGPYFGILASASSSATVYNSNPAGTSTVETKGTPSNLKALDFGITGGLGLMAENGFVMGLKYSRGFSSVFTNETNVNSVFQLFVGYEFGGRR